jgi:hypothetical protein
MADAVTSQTLIDGPTHTVMKFTNISDGTGESAVTKVDVSGLQTSQNGHNMHRCKDRAHLVAVYRYESADTV